MATPQFGIFGPTPEQIRMAEQARREQTYAQQAQGMGAFGPLYQISRGLSSQGINMLGQSLFPQAQSPQLQQATALQQLRQKYTGVNLSDPNNMMKLAQDLSSVGAVDQAMAVAAQAKKMIPDSPFGKIDPSKYTPESIKKFTEAGGKPEDISLLETIDGVIKPTPTFQQTAAGLGIPVKNNLKSYTTDEVRKVNDELNKQAMDKARASAAKINFADPASKFKAISEVNSNLKPYAESLTNSINGIQLGMMRNSPFAQKGFETTVGNIFGDKVRAQAEIERLRNSGNLGERLTNTLSLFLTGKIGEATKDDQMEVLLALYEQNKNQYDMFAQPYRSAAGDITKADEIAPLAATRFSLPPLPPGKQYIPMSAVVANELKKNEQFKYKGEVYKYNGDGTISKVKGQ